MTQTNSAVTVAIKASMEHAKLCMGMRLGTRRYLDLDCPHLSADAVDALVAANPALVGIDSLNIDDPADPARPAHQRLLGADIPIIEHLANLESLPDDGARLIAVPAPVRGMASFPIRAVAVLAG